MHVNIGYKRGTEVKACKGTRLASATCTERVDGPHATVSISAGFYLHCHMIAHSTASSKFKTATCDTDTSLLVHTDCSAAKAQKFAATCSGVARSLVLAGHPLYASPLAPR